MAGRLFVRGDAHGDFDFLPYFCEENQTDYQDILVILGDAGLLYYGENKLREKYLKEYVARQPITIICVRGNHEDRPKNRSNMEVVTICQKEIAGTFYYEPEYSSILYAIDGESYVLQGKACFVVGGAYSVDKWYRIRMGWNWFCDEELTDEEMTEVLINCHGKTYDHIFSHTCPYEWEPTDLFLPMIDQNTVSKNMEHFLTKVANNCNWGEWWFGHFHADRMDVCGDGKVHMLFNKVEEIV